MAQDCATFTLVLFHMSVPSGWAAIEVCEKDIIVVGRRRIQHFSNGNTSKPNFGFEANTGVIGVSFFFH